jgi:hypothetical protein
MQDQDQEERIAEAIGTNKAPREQQGTATPLGHGVQVDLHMLPEKRVVEV